MSRNRFIEGSSGRISHPRARLGCLAGHGGCRGPERRFDLAFQQGARPARVSGVIAGVLAAPLHQARMGGIGAGRSGYSPLASGRTGKVDLCACFPTGCAATDSGVARVALGSNGPTTNDNPLPPNRPLPMPFPGRTTSKPCMTGKAAVSCSYCPMRAAGLTGASVQLPNAPQRGL